MRLNKTAKILIATGTTLITGALFFSRKSKAASLQQHTLTAQSATSSGSSTTSNAKVISHHDRVYDYKYENGRWYTRKKEAAHGQTCKLPFLHKLINWLFLAYKNMFNINKTIMAKKRITTGKEKSTSKMTKGKLSSQGSEIMRIAKRIRKANPRKKWTTCVKEAGKEFKKKRV